MGSWHISGETEGHHREPMYREARTRLHPLPAVGKSRPKAEEGHDPRSDTWKKKGAGLCPSNWDHKEPGQNGTCESGRSRGLRSGDWSPFTSLSCQVQCMTPFHHQQTSTDGEWGRTHCVGYPEGEEQWHTYWQIQMAPWQGSLCTGWHLGAGETEKESGTGTTLQGQMAADLAIPIWGWV